MRTVDLLTFRNLPVDCIGWDAHQGLVDELAQQFGGKHRTFLTADAILDDYPDVDLIVARDLLFHLDHQYVEEVLRKVRLANCFLITTGFLGTQSNKEPTRYLPIPDWGLHPIILNIEPYSLAQSMVIAMHEPGCDYKGMRRFICLYSPNP